MLKVGEQVEVMWSVEKPWKDYWLPGVVSAATADMYQVKFYDGDEKWFPSNRVRHIETSLANFQVGEDVSFRYPGDWIDEEQGTRTPEWLHYEGHIDDIKGNAALIKCMGESQSGDWISATHLEKRDSTIF